MIFLYVPAEICISRIESRGEDKQVHETTGMILSLCEQFFRRSLEWTIEVDGTQVVKAKYHALILTPNRKDFQVTVDGSTMPAEKSIEFSRVGAVPLLCR